MRHLFLSFAIIQCLLAVTPAHADAARTCVFVETLANLPRDMAHLRAGKGDVATFERNLVVVRSRLGDVRRAVLFNPSERQVMLQYLDAVRRDWASYGMDATGKPASTPVIRPQNLRNMLSIVEKFGCTYPKKFDEVPLKGFDAGSISLLTVLLVITALLLIIFGVMKALRYGHRDKRIICRVAANLKVSGATHPTQIVNISRGGVMVSAPEVDIENASVTLGLPNVAIASRVVWVNKNFAGLAFEKKITLQKVEEIANTKAPAPVKDAVVMSQSRASQA